MSNDYEGKFIDIPVCIDEFGDGVYRRIFENSGRWHAIEKYSGTVISED
jgi:hypothetical protein